MNFFSMLLRNGRVLIRSYKLSFTNDLQLQILSYSAACITVAKNLPQLEIGVHRIPRTLHDAISEEDIDRTGKGPKCNGRASTGISFIAYMVDVGNMRKLLHTGEFAKNRKLPLFQSPFPMEISTNQKLSAPLYVTYQSFIWQ